MAKTCKLDSLFFDFLQAQEGELFNSSRFSAFRWDLDFCIHCTPLLGLPGGEGKKQWEEKERRKKWGEKNSTNLEEYCI